MPGPEEAWGGRYLRSRPRSVGHDPQQSQFVERGTVRWLADHLPFFDPDYYDRDDRPARSFARKALGELSVLLSLRLRLQQGPLSGAYQAMVDRLAIVAARPSYQGLIPRQPRSLSSFVLTYVALRLSGRDDPEFRWLLEQSVALRYSITWERLTWRHLEFVHFLSMAEIPHRLLPASAAFPLTLLNGEPNVMSLSEEDAYAITHTLFYATDYGLSPPVWSGDFDVAAATDLVLALLRLYRMKEQSDLVAEFAACAVALGVSESAELDAAWRHLADVQRSDGSLPSPQHLEPGGTLDDHYGEGYRAWRTAYHTTSVTAIAALMARRASWDGGYPVREEAVSVSSGEKRSSVPSERLVLAVNRAMPWLRVNAECKPFEARTAADAALAAAAVCLGAELTGQAGQLANASALLSERLVEVESREIRWGVLGPTGRRALVAFIGRMPGVPRLSLADVADQHDEAAGDAADLKTDGLTYDLVGACRQYHLGKAAYLVQMLTIAGKYGDRCTKNGVEFLLAQQRRDGSFGYFTKSTENHEVDQLRLFWTIRIVATIAAYESGSRLTESNPED